MDWTHTDVIEIGNGKRKRPTVDNSSMAMSMKPHHPQSQMDSTAQDLQDRQHQQTEACSTVSDPIQSCRSDRKDPSVLPAQSVLVMGSAQKEIDLDTQTRMSVSVIKTVRGSENGRKEVDRVARILPRHTRLLRLLFPQKICVQSMLFRPQSNRPIGLLHLQMQPRQCPLVVSALNVFKFHCSLIFVRLRKKITISHLSSLKRPFSANTKAQRGPI